MSVEVSRFSYSQGRDLLNIKAWFDANASEFFDSIELSENVLLLKNGDSTAVSVTLGSTYSITVYVNDDVAVTIDESSVGYISRLAKTSHGIALGFTGTGNIGEMGYAIFIGKTNKGNTGVVINSSAGRQPASSNYYFESIGGTRSSSPTMVPPSIIAAQTTTLTPVICDGAIGEYMPDCFFTSFSQYRGIDCIFTADGTDYLYNGFIAMR